MLDRAVAARALGSLIFSCVLSIGPAPAQIGLGPGAAPSSYPGYPYAGNYPGATFPGGPGLGWGYYGLAGGPFVGWPGVRGAYGGYWTNGLSLYGPPIPTYGPTPGSFGNSDQVRHWQQYPWTPGFGWFGIYAASPRPRPTVSAWAGAKFEPVPALPPNVTAAPPGGAGLILSVKVPQHAAEVFVDGVKTGQTGTDRTFGSPPLEGGKEYRYELTARWVEGGTVVERTMSAIGRPGDVVRVDFTGPDAAQAAK